MPKADMSALAAGLAAGAKPKAKPKRSRRLKVDNQRVYEFKREGTKVLRKTVYFSPQEWKAIEKAAAARATSATSVIREAVRESLEL